MVDKEHSTLTGASLHEPKGVAAAAANKVYLSNGAASGSWTTIPAATIDAAGIKVFQSQKYHIRDERSSGTAADTLTASGTWNTRALNTEKTDDLTITLSGNQFSLAAGTYWADGWVSVFFDNNLTSPFAAIVEWINKLRLRNITDSTTALVGDSIRVQNGGGGGNAEYKYTYKLNVRGQFTIAGSKAFELQHYFTNITNTATLRGGVPASSGENEVYADLAIWKLS